MSTAVGETRILATSSYLDTVVSTTISPSAGLCALVRQQEEYVGHGSIVQCRRKHLPSAQTSCGAFWRVAVWYFILDEKIKSPSLTPVMPEMPVPSRLFRGLVKVRMTNTGRLAPFLCMCLPASAGRSWRDDRVGHPEVHRNMMPRPTGASPPHKQVLKVGRYAADLVAP